MNIEAWQTQQKAQKEDERKRKTAAQDALKGYRGGINESDTKLAALREEERRKREEAEAQHRGYRGTLSEKDKKLLAEREAERQRRQAEEQRLRALGGRENIEAADAIAAGSVSAMAGKLNGAGDETTAEASGSMDIAGQVAPVNGTASEAISVMDETPPTTDGAINGSKVEMNGMDSQPPAALTETDMFSSIVGETQQPSLTPSTYTFDAAFTFGLITTDENPTCEKYLASTAKLVESIRSQTLDLAFETPTVRSYQKDESFMDPAGRVNVYRYLVVVSVPSIATNGAMCQDTRDAVVEGVRRSIQYGTFGF